MVAMETVVRHPVSRFLPEVVWEESFYSSPNNKFPRNFYFSRIARDSRENKTKNNLIGDDVYSSASQSIP